MELICHKHLFHFELRAGIIQTMSKIVKQFTTKSAKIHEHADQKVLSVLSSKYSNLPLDVTAREYCLKYCRAHLEKNFKLERLASEKIPSVFKKHNVICFVTIYLKNLLISCISGHGDSVISSIDHAIEKHKSLDFSLKKTKIAISFLFDSKVKPINEIQLGLDALAIEKENKIAFFKNSVPIHHGFSLSKTLEELSKKAGLSKDSYLESCVKIHTFNAIEFIEDKNKSLCDWYRGRPLILHSEITKVYLTASIKNALSYLEKSIKLTGEIAYLYTRKKTIKKKESLSTATRKLATLWQSFIVSQSHFFRTEIMRIIKNYFKGNKNIGCLLISGETHLGLNSFALLSILAIDDLDFLPMETEGLTAWIESQLNSDLSRFFVTGENELFFPAQALLAFIELYKKKKQKKYLKYCYSVLPYYQELYNKSQKKILMSCWFTRAYSELFLITNNSIFSEFVFQITDPLLTLQIPVGYDEVDLTGAFTKDGNIRTTATLTESLLSAYDVAVKLRDTSRVEHYEKIITLALRAIIQLQNTKHNCHDPNAIGGFRNTLFDSSIRVDNIQHALGALYNALKKLPAEIENRQTA